MKAKSLMTAFLVLSLPLVSGQALAENLPVDLVISRSQHGINITIDIGHGPNGAPFDNVDLSSSIRAHGRGWGTMLQQGQRNVTSRTAGDIPIGPVFGGSGLTLTISILADNSGVMFARNTRVGSALAAFAPVDSQTVALVSEIPVSDCTFCTPEALPFDPPPTTAPSTTKSVTALADDPQITEVPEPTSLILIGTGLFSLAIWRVHRAKRGTP